MGRASAEGRRPVPRPVVGNQRRGRGRAAAAGRPRRRRGAVDAATPSRINVAGAVALGKQLVADGRTDARVATILCDSGFRYLSTIFNADWLRDKGLPVFDWLRD